MTDDEFKCEICHGVFTKGRSDEEAKAEMMERYGDIITEDEPIGVVCDDCHKKIVQEQDTPTPELPAEREVSNGS